MDYLHDKKYYNEIYDLFTIKECLRTIDTFRQMYQDSLKDKKIKDIPQEEKLKGINYLLNQRIFITTGERYRNKNQWIDEMMAEDKNKQEYYDTTSEPSNITCNTCGKRLTSDTKILEDYTDQPMRVLFFFPCSKCKTKRAVYNTGEEFQSKPLSCPKCNSEIIETHKINNKPKGKIITWKRKCSSCGYFEEEVDDFEKKDIERKQCEDEEKQLLEKYRAEYCLSEEKGQEYIKTIEIMKVAKDVFEEEKQKYDNKVYQRSVTLKRLSIVELDKLLSKPLEKEGFIKLSFGTPDMGQHVIVPFNVQDSNTTRKDYVSSNTLQKIIKDTLEDTNWRLMSEGIHYRLGYLSGRLKGHESEEDMLELAGKQKEQPKPAVNQEVRMKYGGENLVNLARMMGQHEGIENMRKRRLEKEPDGFFLEASEGPYNCGICGELTQGNDTWWNLDGLRCRDCWRNIQDGTIPSLKHRYSSDDTYYQDWQISSDFSIHSSTIRKLKREGLLHGRDLKRPDSTVYCTIYLAEENRDFLAKYPKKSKLNVEFINTGGKKVQL